MRGGVVPCGCQNRFPQNQGLTQPRSSLTSSGSPKSRTEVSAAPHSRWGSGWTQPGTGILGRRFGAMPGPERAPRTGPVALVLTKRKLLRSPQLRLFSPGASCTLWPSALSARPARRGQEGTDLTLRAGRAVSGGMVRQAQDPRGFPGKRLRNTETRCEVRQAGGRQALPVSGRECYWLGTDVRVRIFKNQ